MKRSIIRIDEAKCNGCELCIPNCPEGAIRMVDGKARLVGDLYCDGLGACLGHCPEGAITVEEREAEAYDERSVMENIVRQGPAAIRAHLDHLREHDEKDNLDAALAVLEEKGMGIPQNPQESAGHAAEHSGCPGSRAMVFDRGGKAGNEEGARPSQLTHWPVQLHLISPAAPQYAGSDVLLAADCVAFAMGDFHKDHLKGKTLAIACPKLDEGQEIYVEKIKALIERAGINTLTVMIMQVPCCGGLLHVAQVAASQASRRVPLKCIVVGLQGEVLQENWVNL